MKNALYSLLLLTGPTEIEKISEALGHLIGKHIEKLDLPLDLNALAKGIEEEKEGKKSPLDEEDCLEAIASFQKKKENELEEKNLKEAERFLLKNKEAAGIHVLADGKLQYQIVREGKGQTVQSYNCPIIRISGRYLDGKEFSAALEEELIVLEESISALRIGLEGMSQGEIRTLYAHPTLGYGEETHLQPGALLVFEVEVVQADAGFDEEISLDSSIQ